MADAPKSASGGTPTAHSQEWDTYLSVDAAVSSRNCEASVLEKTVCVSRAEKSFSDVSWRFLDFSMILSVMTA